MWTIENEEIWEAIINQNDEMEFDWIGIDKCGQVAAFSNFNSGYTPSCVTSSMTLYNELVTFIDALEKTSGAVKVTDGNGKYDDFEEFARKGIFGYDNENVHSIGRRNRYHLLYKPAKPINSTTPIDLRKFELIIPVFALEFKDLLQFDELKDALI